MGNPGRHATSMHARGTELGPACANKPKSNLHADWIPWDEQIRAERMRDTLLSRNPRLAAKFAKHSQGNSTSSSMDTNNGQKFLFAIQNPSQAQVERRAESARVDVQATSSQSASRNASAMAHTSASMLEAIHSEFVLKHLPLGWHTRRVMRSMLHVGVLTLLRK